MSLSISLAKKLLKLQNGETLPSSQLKQEIAEELSEEGVILIRSNGRRSTFVLSSKKSLDYYLAQKYNITSDLNDWVKAAESDDTTRAELVEYTNDSKTNNIRTFRGFLIKSIDIITASLKDKPFELAGNEGFAYFIQDYEHFVLPDNVIVVGVENGENFQQIHKQAYLFKNHKYVFVSRYPQSNDLKNWLKLIKNKYIHFGDFDLAGISIYQNEFYNNLGEERCSFLIPTDIEKRIEEKGNRALYEKQYQKYFNMEIKDDNLKDLATIIKKHGKCYEQEGYILNPKELNCNKENDKIEGL